MKKYLLLMMILMLFSCRTYKNIDNLYYDDIYIGFENKNLPKNYSIYYIKKRFFIDSRNLNKELPYSFLTITLYKAYSKGKICEIAKYSIDELNILLSQSKYKALKIENNQLMPDNKRYHYREYETMNIIKTHSDAECSKPLNVLIEGADYEIINV